MSEEKIEVEFKGTRISDPSFKNWIIDKEFFRFFVENTTDKRSRREVKDIQEALMYIMESRIVNEVIGIYTIKDYNTKVKAIEAEIQEALGPQSPKQVRQ